VKRASLGGHTTSKSDPFGTRSNRARCTFPTGCTSPTGRCSARCFADTRTTPEQCFFGLWADYGFAGTPLVHEESPPVAPLPDPIHEAVRAGRLVELPGRSL